jgi:hypothetical protein
MNKHNKAKAIDRLTKLLKMIPALKQTRRGSSEFQQWQRNAGVAIANTFGESSRHFDEFNLIPYSLMLITGGET